MTIPIETKTAEKKRIRESMSRWEGMDQTARRLGRGLGRRELIGRVARECGKSARVVSEALGPRAEPSDA